MPYHRNNPCETCRVNGYRECALPERHFLSAEVSEKGGTEPASYSPSESTGDPSRQFSDWAASIVPARPKPRTFMRRFGETDEEFSRRIRQDSGELPAPAPAPMDDEATVKLGPPPSKNST